MPKPTRHNPEFSREREFKVILEDIQSQFRTFGEGLTDLRERMEHVEEIVPRVENIERDVAAIKFVIPTLATKKDLQAFEKRLTALESTR
ncbi:MAG: hypothetical protein HY584_00885 [Candidatus Omnitrophica bacterium]|nr:hypothetical protein [Candidatus Omnitrophota bacterium]